MSSRRFSEHERRQADRFFDDLMGLSRSRRSSSAATAETLVEADGWRDLRNGRVVFYDEDTLRFIEGWTRADGKDRVFLVNRSNFTSRRLHRANPDGTKKDRLPRSGNVLREALRIFSGEPR